MSNLERSYVGKRVLVTGHTGFKGSWLALWLTQMGAQVTGLSDDVPTSPSHYESLLLGNKIRDVRGDIRDLRTGTGLCVPLSSTIIGS